MNLEARHAERTEIRASTQGEAADGSPKRQLGVRVQKRREPRRMSRWQKAHASQNTRTNSGVAPAERLNHAYAWLNCAGAQLNQAPAGLG